MLRLPLSFIKGSPQGLIHRIIMCLGIPRGSHCPVPGGSSGDIAGKSYCFPLHYTSAGKFFLLAAQGILLHQIPESGLVDLRFRHIGKICLRTQRTGTPPEFPPVSLLLVGKIGMLARCVWYPVPKQWIASGAKYSVIRSVLLPVTANICKGCTVSSRNP